MDGSVVGEPDLTMAMAGFTITVADRGNEMPQSTGRDWRRH